MKILLQRMSNTIIVLAGVCVINFFLFQLSPGDPTNMYFGPKTRRANLEMLRTQRGFDQPWYKQFQSWSLLLLKGDLGYSWSKHRPVTEILKEAIPATLQLTCLALLLNILLGCLSGIMTAIYAHRWVGKFLDYSGLALYSVPTFWLALILIFVFSLKLQWLPASQMDSFFSAGLGFWDKAWDRLLHLILPVSVLGLTGAAATSRYVRGQMQEVLTQDYIRLALAKGLSKQKVVLRHAFTNALIPVITLLGIYLPFLLGGAFIVEVIFAWPGMGRVTYEALFAKDFPVIMAVNLIAAVMVIGGNLISDLLYRFVDPRIQINELPA